MATPSAAKTRLPAQIAKVRAAHCQASRRTSFTAAATTKTTTIDGRLMTAALAVFAST